MEAAMGGGASFNVDGDWESICGILSIDEDSDFSNLLGHNPHHQLPTSDDNEGLLSLLMGDANDDPIITSPFAQYYTQQPLPNPNISPQFMSCSTTSLSNNSAKPCNNNDDQVTKRARDHLGLMSRPDHQIPAPKKKARVSKNVGKGKRKTQARKSKFKEAFIEQVVEENVDEDRNSSCSEELAIRDSSGKKRASRGSATDPQSLYARRRRERINERLRILQTLVPNGTKVDISTMLEETVNYVKFLQLQIKLLSSDEMWMYAPLAYNGFDVGHYNTFWS